MLYKLNQCVEKMKSIAVLLNLLHYFYHDIQCAKTYNSVRGEAFEVQHEIDLRSGALKTGKILLRMLILHQIFAICNMSPKLYVSDGNVFFRKLYDR